MQQRTLLLISQYKRRKLLAPRVREHSNQPGSQIVSNEHPSSMPHDVATRQSVNIALHSDVPLSSVVGIKWRPAHGHDAAQWALQDEMDPEPDARKRTTSSPRAVRGGTVGLTGPPTTAPRA